MQKWQFSKSAKAIKSSKIQLDNHLAGELKNNHLKGRFGGLFAFLSVICQQVSEARARFF
jgi:hypothetical protein